jgi:RNA polymerase sigma-70 factor (ECF subfamily)
MTDDAIRPPREAAFSQVLQEHAGLLSRIARSYEANPSLCDDLLQNISLALWRALSTWRGEASMKTFVARIAHNCAASHVIGRTRYSANVPLSGDLPDHGHGPDAHAAARQRCARLQDAVRSLPLALRQTVTLALEGFSQQEIAETLGISANNAGVRLNRARNALKTMLEESA